MLLPPFLPAVFWAWTSPSGAGSEEGPLPLQPVLQAAPGALLFSRPPLPLSSLASWCSACAVTEPQPLQSHFSRCWGWAGSWWAVGRCVVSMDQDSRRATWSPAHRHPVPALPSFGMNPDEQPDRPVPTATAGWTRGSAQGRVSVTAGHQVLPSGRARLSLSEHTGSLCCPASGHTGHLLPSSCVPSVGWAATWAGPKASPTLVPAEPLCWSPTTPPPFPVHGLGC